MSIFAQKVAPEARCRHNKSPLPKHSALINTKLSSSSGANSSIVSIGETYSTLHAVASSTLNMLTPPIVMCAVPGQYLPVTCRTPDAQEARSLSCAICVVKNKNKCHSQASLISYRAIGEDEQIYKYIPFIVSNIAEQFPSFSEVKVLFTRLDT